MERGRRLWKVGKVDFSPVAILFFLLLEFLYLEKIGGEEAVAESGEESCGFYIDQKKG